MNSSDERDHAEERFNRESVSEENMRERRAAEGPTSITESTAMHILVRMVGLAARCAVGDGLEREAVAQVLESEAYAIRTQDVAEDMSPILFHHA